MNRALDEALRSLDADPEDRDALERARALLRRQPAEDPALRLRLAILGIEQSPGGELPISDAPPVLSKPGSNWRETALQIAPGGGFVHFRGRRSPGDGGPRVFDFQLWDRERGRCLNAATAFRVDARHPSPRLVFSPDGGLALSDHPGDPTRWVLLYDLEARTMTSVDILESFNTMAVSRIPNGARIALSSDDELWIYELRAEEEASLLAQVPLDEAPGIAEKDRRRVALSASGSKAAYFHADGQVAIMSLDPALTHAGFGLRRLKSAMSEDDRWLATDPAGRRVYACAEAAVTSARWDGSDLKVFEVGAPTRALAFDPDGALAITGDPRGRISFWEAETGALLGHADGLPPISGLALDLARGQLLAACEDRTLRCWPF